MELPPPAIVLFFSGFSSLLLLAHKLYPWNSLALLKTKTTVFCAFVVTGSSILAVVSSLTRWPIPGLARQMLLESSWMITVYRQTLFSLQLAEPSCRAVKSFLTATILTVLVQLAGFSTKHVGVKMGHEWFYSGTCMFYFCAAWDSHNIDIESNSGQIRLKAFAGTFAVAAIVIVITLPILKQKYWLLVINAVACFAQLAVISIQLCTLYIRAIPGPRTDSSRSSYAQFENTKTESSISKV